LRQLACIRRITQFFREREDGVTPDMAATMAGLTERLERISASHAERFAIRRDDDWYVMKLGEELGELIQAWLKLTGRGRRVGTEPTGLKSQLGEETADLLCQLLLFARRFDIDLMANVRRKWLIFDPAGDPPAPRRMSPAE
jgi:NTP pyrophosphatase (non-canonical NTP hydrolase)